MTPFPLWKSRLTPFSFDFTLETQQKPGAPPRPVSTGRGGEDLSRQVGSAQSSLATTGHGGHHARGDGGQGVGGWLGDRGDG